MHKSNLSFLQIGFLVMSLKKQGLTNAIGNIGYFIALWLLTVITTRFLGYEAAGTLTLAMAVGNTTAMVQFYGVRPYQSSDTSFQYSPRDYLKARLISVPVGILLGAAACLILGYQTWVTVSVLLFIMIKSSESFSDVLFGDIQRAGKLEIAGYTMLVRGGILILSFASGALLFRNLNLALLFSAAATTILSLTLDFPLYRKTLKNHVNESGKGPIGVFKNCFPLLISTLIPVVITAFPRIVLEHYCGSELLGYYGNVSTPALLLTTIIPTILTAMLTQYGKSFNERDFSSVFKTWINSIVVTLLCSGVCILGVFLVGKPVLSLAYTDQILPYFNYLYTVLLAMTLYALTLCNNTVLISIRKNWTVTVLSVLALIINLAVSIPLISSFEISGAIASLALPYGIQTVIQTVFILKLFRDNKRRTKNETDPS